MIEYTLKVNKRTRGIRLAVYGDGRITVTVPRRVSRYFLDRFIVSRAEWIREKVSRFEAINKRRPAEKPSRPYAEAKDEALTFVKSRLEILNQAYGHSFNNVSVKNQKTRWGSCSKKGNLNFNYRIADLPLHLADYIVAHELCHLKEMNHSKSFWDLVARSIPNHRECRRLLKEIGIMHSL